MKNNGKKCEPIAFHFMSYYKNRNAGCLSSKKIVSLAFDKYAKEFYDCEKNLCIKKCQKENSRQEKILTEREWEITKGTLIPFFKDYPINRIAKDDIEDFIERLRNTGLSYKTSTKILNTLNKIFKDAICKGYIDFNPVKSVVEQDLKREFEQFGDVKGFGSVCLPHAPDVKFDW